MNIRELIESIAECTGLTGIVCKYLPGVLTDNLYLYAYTDRSTITTYLIPNGTGDDVIKKINSLGLDPETPILITDHLNDLGYIIFNNDNISSLEEIITNTIEELYPTIKVFNVIVKDTVYIELTDREEQRDRLSMFRLNKACFELFNHYDWSIVFDEERYTANIRSITYTPSAIETLLYKLSELHLE